MKKQLSILFTFISLGIITCFVSGQICFSYDGAGNRINRQSCVPPSIVSITEEPMEELKEIIKDENKGHISKNITSLIVYPNPNDGSFRIKDQDYLLTSKLTIIDQYGRIIDMIKIELEDIDLTYLPTGSYLLIAELDNKKYFGKLIINH